MRASSISMGPQCQKKVAINGCSGSCDETLLVLERDESRMLDRNDELIPLTTKWTCLATSGMKKRLQEAKIEASYSVDSK